MNLVKKACISWVTIYVYIPRTDPSRTMMVTRHWMMHASNTRKQEAILLDLLEEKNKHTRQVSTEDKQKEFVNVAGNGRIDDLRKYLNDDTVNVNGMAPCGDSPTTSTDLFRLVRIMVIVILQSFYGSRSQSQCNALWLDPCHVGMFAWSCFRLKAFVGSWLQSQFCW